MKTLKINRKSGFTLVEIMIVVAIIGLLAAIAIPNFVRARQTSQTNACINNLRIIDAAKAAMGFEKGADYHGHSKFHGHCSLLGPFWYGNATCPLGGVLQHQCLVGCTYVSECQLQYSRCGSFAIIYVRD